MIVRLMNKNLARRVSRLGIPVVAVQGVVPGGSLPLVQSDDRAIAELAAGYLMGHRLRSFGFCGLRGAYWSRVRRDGFCAAVGKFGYQPHRYELPPRSSKAWFSQAERKRLTHWIAQLPKPIGIMACNDWAGQKVLEACRGAGAMVPEEVAVLGVDNDETICDLCDPMLSSVTAGHDRVGYEAAALLEQMMRGESPPREPMVVGTPRIVVRQSTDLQTIADRDIVAALRYIRENACHGIRVHDVAAQVALSDSTLYRRFERALSRSVNDEIMRVRMERVCELLTQTEMTLTHIARATGFRHQEYLGAVFKLRTGMTPGQFRRENARSSSRLHG